MPATKERSKKGVDALEQALTDAETEFAAASAEHAAAKQVYADARAAKDVEAMAPALARAEAAADLKQDAEGKVAAAQDALRVRRAAAQQQAFLADAEKVALQMAAECKAVDDLRAKLANALLTIPRAIYEAQQRRESLRRQLAQLDKSYPDDLAPAIEARGNVKLGGVLNRPQYAADWGDQRFGGSEWNGVQIDALINALIETQTQRGARLGAQRGVVI